HACGRGLRPPARPPQAAAAAAVSRRGDNPRPRNRGRIQSCLWLDTTQVCGRSLRTRSSCASCPRNNKALLILLCFIHSPPWPSPRLVAEARLRLARNSARLSHDLEFEAAIIIHALPLCIRHMARLCHHGRVLMRGRGGIWRGGGLSGRPP